MVMVRKCTDVTELIAEIIRSFCGENRGQNMKLENVSGTRAKKVDGCNLLELYRSR